MECQYLNCCARDPYTNGHTSVGFLDLPLASLSHSGSFCPSLSAVATEASTQEATLSVHSVQSILIGLGGVSVFIPLNLVAKKR